MRFFSRRPFSLARKIALLLPVVALLLVFAAASPARAEPRDASIAFIDTLSAKALSSLTSGDQLSRKDREKRVRALLNDYFDVNTIGRFTLGPHWRNATPAQQREYLKLFEQMIVATYAERFAEYSGQSIKIGRAIKASDRDTVVTSQIIQPDGPPIAVDWRIRKTGDQRRIIDVIVEGISMSVTQRSDFAAVVQNRGMDGLLEDLRRRTSR